MSGDNRSVTTDALATLGTIIETGGRDAIHLAVNPTVAAEKLYPGQDVGVDGTRNSPVGIVDPFLKAPVQPGEMFWLVVYPRQINSLRHVWTHPAFPDEKYAGSSVKKSEKWLRDFVASSECPSYDEVMTVATYSTGDSLCFGDRASGNIPPEFWDHYEVVTGKTKPTNQRATYFSCAC